MIHNKKARLALAASVAAGLMLSGCGGDATPEGEASGGSAAAAAATEIVLLTDNGEQSINIAEALLEEYNASQDEVVVKHETRPSGGDGDNFVKTRLATGEMNDVFMYNSGSLMVAIDPSSNLVPLTDEDFMDGLNDTFKTAVSYEDEVYGVPFEQAMGGGILYNKKVYEELGLEIPKTWDAFMENNAIIKEAGLDPVISTFGETWTAQLLVLADFHNVASADPEWAEKYTAGEAKYVDEPALLGFKRMQEVYDAGYLNRDFASAKQAQGMQQLVDGTGVHYPMLTASVSAYVDLTETAAEDIGFMAQPGQNEADYGLTVWTPAGMYIPKTTEGDKLEAAKKFLAWAATPAACDAVSKHTVPNGPYMVNGCELPDGLPQAVADLADYINNGQSTPALEFLSPIKGPNLEKIMVEVGSGIATAEEAAARYDEDVKKQAQQLGIEGW